MKNGRKFWKTDYGWMETFWLIATCREKLGVLARKWNEINNLIETREDTDAIQKQMFNLCWMLNVQSILHDAASAFDRPGLFCNKEHALESCETVKGGIP